MISAADVSAAGSATLKAFLPRALALGVNGRPALPAPTSYSEVPTADAIRRVKRSVIAVSVPRVLSTERFGDGSYDATFLLSVAVWHEQAADLPLLTAAADYVTAIRKTILSHQSLGGIAEQTTWTDESVDLLGDGLSSISLGFGVCEFAVRVPQVVDEEPLSLTGPAPSVVESSVFVNPK